MNNLAIKKISQSCKICGREMPIERYELFGLTICSRCAPQNKIKGVMEYSHKTAGILVLCETEEEFHMLKKPANRRR